MHWQTTRFSIDLGRPRVMGIVNVTPDSFSDGGHHAGAAAALAHCEQLLREGADILDIGGESSRPGAQPVPLDEELARVMPVLQGALAMGCPLSLDTAKPELMRAALDQGVDIINDITALRMPGAMDAVAAHPSCGVCLMHMQGEPGTMQSNPSYRDVVCEVRDYLAGRIAAAEAAGIARERILADPGFGFGKSLEHNLELLRAFAEFRSLGVALLAGLSRKTMLGKLTGREPRERVHASVAAALVAVQNGAHIVRVHDVAATRDALAVWQAVKNQN